MLKLAWLKIYTNKSLKDWSVIALNVDSQSDCLIRAGYYILSLDFLFRLDKFFDVFKVGQDLEVGLKAGSAVEGSARSAKLCRKNRRIDGMLKGLDIGVEEDAVADALVQKRFDQLKSVWFKLFIDSVTRWLDYVSFFRHLQQ